MLLTLLSGVCEVSVESWRRSVVVWLTIAFVDVSISCLQQSCHSCNQCLLIKMLYIFFLFSNIFLLTLSLPKATIGARGTVSGVNYSRPHSVAAIGDYRHCIYAIYVSGT